MVLLLARLIGPAYKYTTYRRFFFKKVLHEWARQNSGVYWGREGKNHGGSGPCSTCDRQGFQSVHGPIPESAGHVRGTVGRSIVGTHDGHKTYGKKRVHL